MIVNLIGLIICYTLFERVLSDSNSTVGKLSNFENFALNDSKVENFVRTYKLADGQIITKLKYFNVSAIETKFDNLYLRQITDGIHLIQLWLSDEVLLDCEFTINRRSINQLLKEFNQRIINSNNNLYTNLTILSDDNNSENQTLPSKLSYLTDYQLNHDRCHQLHKKFRTQFKIKIKSNQLRKKQRWKRADLLLFPGTNWCGKGSNSRNFEDLGEHSFADRCCRDHDECKYTIGPFSWKYNLFNYRFHYVSHCSCDERFRSCLKIANTGAANLVGKLFFNVVQTKCFLFRTEKVCNRRSWWGKCLKMKRKKRAFFRNGLRY